MANSEISINDKLADVLRAMNTDWRLYDHVSSENTEGLSKKKALRPDILITVPGAPPICLETEYEPGLSVEADAANRLGQVAVKFGGTIQAAFAIRIPTRFKTIAAPKLLNELRKAQDFQYCCSLRFISRTIRALARRRLSARFSGRLVCCFGGSCHATKRNSERR